MQHKSCCVNLICRSWTTWKTNQITPACLNYKQDSWTYCALFLDAYWIARPLLHLRVSWIRVFFPPASSEDHNDVKIVSVISCTALKQRWHLILKNVSNQHLSVLSSLPSYNDFIRVSHPQNASQHHVRTFKDEIHGVSSDSTLPPSQFPCLTTLLHNSKAPGRQSTYTTQIPLPRSKNSPSRSRERKSRFNRGDYQHQSSGRFLGIIGWDPSVCKSNRL